LYLTAKQKVETMPKEITGFLILERSNPASFISTNDIQFILGLNEGHDRPVWEWMLNGSNTNAKRASTLVPEKVETVLLDGLLLLIADGLKDQSLLAKIDEFRRGPSSLIDLNHQIVPSELREGIAGALEGFVVNVVILNESILKTSADTLSKLGIKYRVLQ
jgi:hypothetical protein